MGVSVWVGVFCLRTCPRRKQKNNNFAENVNPTKYAKKIIFVMTKYKKKKLIESECLMLFEENCEDQINRSEEAKDDA